MYRGDDGVKVKFLVRLKHYLLTFHTVLRFMIGILSEDVQDILFRLVKLFDEFETDNTRYIYVLVFGYSVKPVSNDNNN